MMNTYSSGGSGSETVDLSWRPLSTGPRCHVQKGSPRGACAVAVRASRTAWNPSSSTRGSIPYASRTLGISVKFVLRRISPKWRICRGTPAQRR